MWSRLRVEPDIYAGSRQAWKGGLNVNLYSVIKWPHHHEDSLGSILRQIVLLKARRWITGTLPQRKLGSEGPRHGRRCEIVWKLAEVYILKSHPKSHWYRWAQPLK